MYQGENSSTGKKHTQTRGLGENQDKKDKKQLLEEPLQDEADAIRLANEKEM